MTAKYPFDFVIGSSHVVHGIDPYYPHYYDGRSEDEAYLEYFESILENLHTNVDFDVYGHLDYVVRYGGYENKVIDYEEFRDILDAILAELIKKDKGIEINTSGIRYGLPNPHPNIDIIRRFKELGGKIITIGSDAHKVEDLAKDFNLV